jgi:hypothetical protein
MKPEQWISVKEAAAIVGYSAAYFREAFCADGAPLVTVRVKRSLRRRTIWVSRTSVDALMRSQTTAAAPQGGAGCS